MMDGLNRFSLIVVLIVTAVWFSPVHARGTRANTPITNYVSVDYILAGVPNTATASVSTAVDELLDVSVSWLNAANVSVMSPSAAQILMFRVSNTGNGVEDFILNVVTANSAPQFNPVAIRLWEDTNGNGVLNTVGDTQIPLGGSIRLDGAVVGGDAVAVFVVADIPAGLSAGMLGDVRLTAVSQTASVNAKAGLVGSVISGAGDGGAVDALVGTTGAEGAATGIYQVVANVVNITKSVAVSDHRGGTSPYPGSVLTYTLLVDVSGSVAVNNLLISDVVPGDTFFDSSTDSIRLNGVLQTNADNAPVDFTRFNALNQSIEVDLSQGGTVSVMPPVLISITFDVVVD